MLASGTAQYNKSISQFYANWSDCTILAFAADYSGFNGPLVRILVQPTKEGAASIEELAPVSAPVPGSILMIEPAAELKRVSFENRMKEVRIGRSL